MDILNFVFDPLNFAGGFAAASAVYGAKSVVSKWSQSGVATKIESVSSEYKLLYPGFNSAFEKAESSAQAFKHDFRIAFPDAVIPIPSIFTRLDTMKTLLNGMLADFNALDNQHLKRDAVARIEKSLAEKKKSFTATLSDTEFLINGNAKNFRENMAELTKFKDTLKNLQERLTEAKDQYAVAEQVYDKVYLEKIPPALFEAEKAWDRFAGMVAQAGYSSEDAIFMTVDESVQKKAETTVRRAENHLNRVLNYGQSAMRETSKMRQRLRSWPPRTAEQTVAYNLALESLMDAESRPYDKANPVDEFDVATLPYLRYLHDRAGKRR